MRPQDHHVAPPPDHHEHHHHSSPAGQPAAGPDRLALAATVHCLTGCAIGEVLGMVAGTAAGLGAGVTSALSIALAFVFGYALTAVPLVRAGMSLDAALGLALASDTASIAIMEVVDTTLMLVVPGAMSAGLDSVRFWGSLALSLLLAGVAAFPVNRWLVARGRGHMLVHGASHDHRAGEEGG